MTTRQESKDARRSSLLRGALAEFNERGFHGASTRSIASAAGVSSGLVFHYFSSKGAIYDELVALGLAEVAVDEHDVADAVADPAGFLRGLATRVLALLDSTPEASAMFTFMARAERQPGVSRRADELFAERDLMKVLVPVIASGQAKGIVRPGEPRALALAYWGALQGVAEVVAVSPGVPLPHPEWLLAIVLDPSPKES